MIYIGLRLTDNSVKYFPSTDSSKWNASPTVKEIVLFRCVKFDPKIKFDEILGPRARSDQGIFFAKRLIAEIFGQSFTLYGIGEQTGEAVDIRWYDEELNGTEREKRGSDKCGEFLKRI